jgi:hypothetical protein
MSVYFVVEVGIRTRPHTKGVPMNAIRTAISKLATDYRDVDSSEASKALAPLATLLRKAASEAKRAGENVGRILNAVHLSNATQAIVEGDERTFETDKRETAVSAWLKDEGIVLDRRRVQEWRKQARDVDGVKDAGFDGTVSAGQLKYVPSDADYAEVADMLTSMNAEGTKLTQNSVRDAMRDAEILPPAEDGGPNAVAASEVDVPDSPAVQAREAVNVLTTLTSEGYVLPQLLQRKLENILKAVKVAKAA